MVVKMMRWRPWPPLLSKKFQVKLVVLRLEGPLSLLPHQPQPQQQQQQPPLPSPKEGEDGRDEEVAMVEEDAAGGDGAGRRTSTATTMAAEVRWKGPKLALSSLRRPSVKRNLTKDAEAREDDGTSPAAVVVEWNEEFQSECCLTSHRDDGVFHPWEVAFSVFLSGSNQGPKNKLSVIGTASLNLAEFASTAEGKESELNIPLCLPGVSTEAPPSLYLAVSLLELRSAQDSGEMVQRPIVPILLSPNSGGPLRVEKDEVSALKAGLRKVKILTELVSTRKSKKTCQEDDGSEGRRSATSEDAEGMYPFDTDSLDDDQDGELEDGKENSSIRKSFSYGTLASANYIGGSSYSEMVMNGEHEDWVYYSHRRSDVGCTYAEETTSSVTEQSTLQTSKRSILPWRKRKLSFRSPKAKGEPLLKKAYGEEGGDDIDFDRRQLSSSDESFGWHKVEDDAVANRSSVSEFGDDNFAVGCWETKEVVSRDGHMKLSTQVFFASIDQRSERAAGESACTALVAVIADWFQKNRGMMPIKSQFDGLIRDGSLEWRNLCENETYRARFPDKHFDLETVLQAKIRPLSVVPRKSFVGFFHLEDFTDGGDNSSFDFLHGAMSFDSIWDEISRAGSECFSSDGSPQLYIVSWNDHFFVLKVESEAYYILDTLGERLYEGCNQAYILKFDKNTSICKKLGEKKYATSDQEEAESGNQQQAQKNTKEEEDKQQQDHGNGDRETEEEVVCCRGKESCKEYIKSFLAAIPIRELRVDIKKGLMASTPIHHRLQIEFHYTEPLERQVVVEAALPPHPPPAAAAAAGAAVAMEFPRPAVEPVDMTFSLTPATTELELGVS